jgi:uridine phosphorylase
MTTSADLVLDADGSIYHLALKPGELAEKILFVGDPGRVERVAAHFDQVELKRQKREFFTITGSYQGQRLSVLSTGIGTDNIDIVWNEVDALFNLDFATRQVKPALTRLQVLRLGTSGGMQPDLPVGSLVHTRYAIGGDGLRHFYPSPLSPAEVQLRAALKAYFPPQTQFPIPLYAAPADPGLDQLIREQFPNIRPGITFTAAGFYGPQGRPLGRIPVFDEQLPRHLADFEYQQTRVLNMEMESAAIFALGELLGHACGTLCVILANRQRGEFSEDPRPLVDELIQTGLEVMLRWT